mgnify:FL=1
MSAATGLTGLTFQLTRARFAVRQGEALLFFASVLANTISAALAFTIAGGTMMFHERWHHPTGVLAALKAEDPTFDLILMFYLILALIATALLVPAMISLSASAAVLGARGREQRLSALRLLGLSSGDVTRMSLIDSAIQASIGTLLGGLSYLVTAPAWGALEFQSQPVALVLPWWLALTVAAANVVIALIATWWGLRQVRISPLGVARRGVKPPTTWKRVAVFVGILVAAFVLLPHLLTGREVMGYVVFAAIIGCVIFGYNLFGPWMLQRFSRLYFLLPGPAALMAGRRIMADPRSAWRRIGGLGILALIAGYLGRMPFEMEAKGSEALAIFSEKVTWDFTKGVVITLAVALMLTATSILISQASSVFERSDLTIALHRLGTPEPFHARAQWLENLGPLALVTTTGYLIGFGLAQPMASLAEKHGLHTPVTGIVVVIAVIVAGFVLAALALLATQPLQKRVLGTQRRRND